MSTAGAIAVEVIADLSQLDAGLRRAEGSAARSGSKIANDLGRVERATDRVGTTSGKAATATERLAASYSRLGTGINSATTASGRLAAANDNIARSAQEASLAAKLLAGAISLISAGALIAVGAAMAKVGMEMVALERSFAAAAGSALQGGREMTFVKAESERLGLSLRETATQYGQLLAASQGTALQGQGTRDIFIAVSQAMTALGKSSADTGGALNAVQQMMSKGKVQAEELRGQLGERLPGAFNLAAAAMGKTTAELNKMLDDGKVTAEVLLPKLAAELTKVYGTASAASAQDLGANINRLSNAWNDFSSAIAQGGLNESLNRAAQALTRFLTESQSAVSIGRSVGNAIDFIVEALERVPRGAENVGILVQMVKDAVLASSQWAASFSPIPEGAVQASSAVGDAFSGMAGFVETAINGVIGVAVAGYEMVGAAWNGLPGVFADISARAGNALVGGIEAAVNYLLGLLQKFVSAWNAVGAALPSGFDFPKLADVGKVTFDRLQNTAAGATEQMGKSLADIGKEALSKNYVGQFGDSVSQTIDGQIQKFRVLRADQDASNHLLREAGKIAKDAKVADAYNNAAKAGKAAKEASEGAGGAAKEAAGAYETLIQRTKDRIAELELEAQYASRTATEVIKLKLAHDLERAAKKDGLDVTQAMRDEWDRLGGSLAAATQKLEASRKAQADLKKAQDSLAESFKSFVEDLITGTDGLNGALKSLGKSFLSNSLDALISGKGPLAGLTGMASNDNKSQGGLFGLLTALPKEVGKASEKGTAKGAVSGITSLAANDNGVSLLGVDGKNLAAGLTAISGLAGAYGVGLSAGSTSQAALGGALSGGMAGLSLAGAGIGSAAVMGPIGLALGVGLAMFGQQQAKKQAKEQRKAEAEANYQNAKNDIATFRSEARGDPQNTLAKRISDAEASARKLADIAFLAGKAAEANEIWADGQIYVARALSEYRDGFGGLLEAMNSGLGPNSPFATAKDQIKEFGVELTTFVKNTATAYGETAPQVQQAREAAAAYALTVLNGSKNLTTVESRFQEIMGTAAGLAKVLTDLGWSAEGAAEAVKNGTTAALARLKSAFESDLQAKTNDASDKGYLNEARNLLNEIGSLARDAQAIGTDPGTVTRYFQAAAQNLVDEAKLTGDAFNEFLTLFPEFTGNVVAAGRALEDASRRLGYIDRLFNATNDTSTLAGQLAAYDRQAMREREDEIKQGGQYILELEAAQQAERFNIIKEFNQAANDNYRQSLQQAQDYVARFTRSIQEYLDGLRAGSGSPLSPQARLAAAQSQYSAQLALAQGGNRDALDGITSYASDLLEAAKAFYSSSSGYQSIFAQIQSQLGALPSQISAEQFIVNAIEAGADQTTSAIDAMKITLQSAVSSGSASEIAAALSTYFNKIDINTSGSIDFPEMQQALSGMASNSQLRDMFTRLDVDNSGSINRLDLINSATGSVKNAVSAQDTLLTSIKQATDSVTQATNLVRSVSDNIAYWSSLSAQNLQTSNSTNGYAHAQTIHLQGIRQNLQAQNAWWGIQSWQPLPQYATGGLIGGKGTGTSDSNMIMASRGEFVMRAAAVDRFGVGMLSQMNDNLRSPVMPVAMGGQSNAALVSELRAMRKELADLKNEMARNTQVAAKGHERTAAAVDEQTDAVKADTRKSKQAGVAGRGAKIAA